MLAFAPAQRQAAQIEVVRRLGAGQQARADLRRWRETFAERLRERGIEAEASPQITRGGSRRTERLWHRKARDDGARPRVA